jgi:hypothetical protein
MPTAGGHKPADDHSVGRIERHPRALDLFGSLLNITVATRSRDTTYPASIPCKTSKHRNGQYGRRRAQMPIRPVGIHIRRSAQISRLGDLNSATLCDDHGIGLQGSSSWPSTRTVGSRGRGSSAGEKTLSGFCAVRGWVSPPARAWPWTRLRAAAQSRDHTEPWFLRADGMPQHPSTGRKYSAGCDLRSFAICVLVAVREVRCTGLGRLGGSFSAAGGCCSQISKGTARSQGLSGPGVQALIRRTGS